jgi:hypothetical protein
MCFPLLFPVLAFSLFDTAVVIFHNILDTIAKDVNWVAVDGGKYQAAILAPTINGVVLPSLSISLGTLVAGTIQTLQQRKIVVKTCLNKETTDLRMILYIMETSYPQEKSTENRILFISLLAQYISRILRETVKRRFFLSSTESVNEEMQPETELYDIGRLSKEVQCYGEKDDNSRSKPASDLSQLQSALYRLSEQRSLRLASLDTVFPAIHWTVLALLSSSVLVCFLLESDQETILFLDNIQLRILFTVSN